MSRPLLIVTSIVRNEAWVLDAFLSAASLWADMIIIADQMSTDGSRDIYKRYPKVHMIDNDRPNMHQAAARRLVLEEVRKILNEDTNAVLFALDADEIFVGNFMHTRAWKQVLHSKPNDCFEWSWMNILPGNANRYSISIPTYWAVHVSEQMWNGVFPDNNIHEWRLPYPSGYSNEIVLTDFYTIHYGRFNDKRQKNKERFYQVHSMESEKCNVVSLYREYHKVRKIEERVIPQDAYLIYEQNGLDIMSMINTYDEGAYYTQEIKEYFAKNGVDKYILLDIWDEDWCTRNNIEKPNRKWHQHLLMWYLEISNPYARTLLVRIIDKLLKMSI